MTFAARTLGFSRSQIIYTFAANTANATLNVTSGTAPAGGTVSGTYKAGATDIKIVIGNGVYVYSTAVGTPGLTLTGGSGTDKIELTNNGYIMGCGGTGGGSNGSSASYLGPTAGGTGLRAGFPLTVINASTRYIAGGGGGGGGGSAVVSGGGGAGGGSGGTAFLSTTIIAGGGPGGLGGNGSAGTTTLVSSSPIATGGGGGRTLPGTASGTVSTSAINGVGGLGGSAGGGGAAIAYNTYGGGGGGGGYGASGGTGSLCGSWVAPSTGGNGGFAGNAGTAATFGAGSSAFTTNAGQLGGKAIDFNGFTVTVSNFGTIYGGQS
jgi:hypothetical protein